MKMLSQLVGPILKLLSCNIVSFFSKTRKRGIAGCAAAAQRIKRAAREEADPALVTDQLARTQRSATSTSHWPGPAEEAAQARNYTPASPHSGLLTQLEQHTRSALCTSIKKSLFSDDFFPPLVLLLSMHRIFACVFFLHLVIFEKKKATIFRMTKVLQTIPFLKQKF